MKKTTEEKEKKYISPSEAKAMGERLGISLSIPTIIKYVEEFELGHQIGGFGGKWYIHPEKWRRFLHGQDNKADNRYRKVFEETGQSIPES